MGAAATGIAAITKASIANYAEYEQLVGGVETLFKNSASVVEAYANNAYRTAGLSANAYMKTVTSFSASLLQSLGGDTEAAASYADMAITDMSDNANKMGSDMASIQNAYQGFAKQNYTMLDNLKLGYGGTKEEMERLLADAEKLSGMEFDISSYADIVQAIHVVQENMGIAGTTAKEASETISGSFASLKAAWENLKTGLVSGEGLDGLIDNLVNSASTVAKNIMPVIGQALGGIAVLIETLVPIIVEQLPGVISAALPPLIEASGSLILALSESFLSPENLDKIITTGVELLLNLANGLMEAIPRLVSATMQVISGMVTYLLNPSNLAMLIGAALQIVIAIGTGLISAIPELISSVWKLIDNVAQQFGEADWGEIGKNLVYGILDGLKAAWDTLTGWASDAWDKFVGIFDFTSNATLAPAKYAYQYGYHGSHASGLDYVPFDGYIAQLHKGERVLTAGEASALRGNNAIVAKLDEIGAYLANMSIVLDDGTLVGKMAPSMNEALGELAVKKGRGR